MLRHRTPPGEIAETLGIDEAWLTARRWAMLERLSGRPTRRTPPRTGGVPAPVGPWSGR